MLLFADYSKKGQMKIQQMAFVLVALMVFAAIVGIVFIILTMSRIESGASDLRDQEAKELVRSIASSAEFRFRDCAFCIDLDRALILKNSEEYREFWNLDYLAFERLMSEEDEECRIGNYPDCSIITVVNRTADFGVAYSSFVSLCRWDSGISDFRCEIGKAHAAGRGIGND